MAAGGPPGPTSEGRIAARGHRRQGLEGGDARAGCGERARGDVVALVVLHGDPLPCPGPGSTPRPGRFVSGTTTDEEHGPPYSIHRRDGDPGDHLLEAAAVTLVAGLRLISWGRETHSRPEIPRRSPCHPCC